MEKLLKELTLLEGKKVTADSILKDVHLVGFQSSNTVEGQKEPYRYTAEALKTAVEAGIYNGIVIGMDHQTEKDINNKASNRIGVTLNSRFIESKGIVGDVKLNPEHPLSKSVIWWAENYPDKMGLSHIAQVKFSESSNSVVSVKKVDIIDFVGNSSTTHGIFAESTSKDPVTLDINDKLYILIESACDNLHKQLHPLEKDLTPEDKVINIVQIVEDLSVKLKEAKTTKPKEPTMEWNDITLETLKANKADLVALVASEAVAAEKLVQTKVKEAIAVLPETARTDVFVTLVESQIRDGKDVAPLIADRKSVITVVESKAPESVKKTEEPKAREISDDDILAAVRG
jgi:hypothetical protein